MRKTAERLYWIYIADKVNNIIYALLAPLIPPAKPGGRPRTMSIALTESLPGTWGKTPGT
jgi:hypothetical protein